MFFIFNKLHLIKISICPTKIVNLKLSLEEVLQAVYIKYLIVLFAPLFYEYLKIITGFKVYS